MAGISEVCNHVGALLYKCIQQRTDVSSTYQPNKWLPAKKNVHPVPVCNLVFKTPKLDKCSSQMIKPKDVVHSVKTANTQLREPTEEEQEGLFLKLSQLDHKASILSIHHNFNKPFIPISQSRSLPEPITSFANADGMKMTSDEIKACCSEIKSTYKITGEEAKDLEESTRLQSKSRLWSIHRTGRITASNFKSIIKTKLKDPSSCLVKKICYPTAYTFSSSASTWGCQHEDVAIDMFLEYFAMERTKVGYTPSRLLVKPKYPFLGASLDAWLTCSCHGRSLIEVKCPYHCRNSSLEQLAST